MELINREDSEATTEKIRLDHVFMKLLREY